MVTKRLCDECIMENKFVNASWHLPYQGHELCHKHYDAMNLPALKRLFQKN